MMYCAKLKSATAERNFLLVKCAWCAKDMILTEGSVILGSEWYHENCFDEFKQTIANPKRHKTGAD